MKTGKSPIRPASFAQNTNEAVVLTYPVSYHGNNPVFATRITLMLIALFLVSLVFNSKAEVNAYSTTFKWNYGGHQFSKTLSFSTEDYSFYKHRSKNMDYAVYATEDYNHKYFMEIAAELDQDAKEFGYTGYELIDFIRCFSQQCVPYESDPSGYNDYPKFPIETLVERGGDCEDKAALMVALLNTFNFDAKLVQLPGHMAVALKCEYGSGNYYNYNGEKYYYIEATNPGFSIGDMPQQYTRANGTILDIDRGDVYDRNGELNPDVEMAYAPTTKPAPDYYNKNDYEFIENGCTCGGKGTIEYVIIEEEVEEEPIYIIDSNNNNNCTCGGTYYYYTVPAPTTQYYIIQR